MADNSPIEWTEATWNPIGGCTRVDEGCRNCYAEVMAARFSKPGQWGEGLAQIVKSADGRTDHRWTGKVVLHEAALERPLRWRRPRLIFVNSTSDLFHESVPDDWIDRIFAVMALCPQHTFQVLTKRPERARAYLTRRDDRGRWPALDYAAIMAATGQWDTPALDLRNGWPLPNVWLGTSISDQASANARIPELLACPAAIRFVSAEPLLGLPDLMHIPARRLSANIIITLDALTGVDGLGVGGPRLDWVICGGESGPGARPMHPDWPRSLRDQCVAAGVPFFFKQWGEWGPGLTNRRGLTYGCFNDAGQWVQPVLRDWAQQDRQIMTKVGKKAAGRLLDGRTWDQMPKGWDR